MRCPEQHVGQRSSLSSVSVRRLVLMAAAVPHGAWLQQGLQEKAFGMPELGVWAFSGSRACECPTVFHSHCLTSCP